MEDKPAVGKMGAGERNDVERWKNRGRKVDQGGRCEGKGGFKEEWRPGVNMESGADEDFMRKIRCIAANWKTIVKIYSKQTKDMMKGRGELERMLEGTTSGGNTGIHKHT